MQKKARCTCKLVVLLNKPYCFFDVFVAVAVVVAKTPYYSYSERYLATFLTRQKGIKQTPNHW